LRRKNEIIFRLHLQSSTPKSPTCARDGVLHRPDQTFILYGMSRFDEHGAHLYHMDPSGTYLKFDAKAIGSGSEGAQQSLQVRNTSGVWDGK
jgi:hypothetical protein